LVIKTLDPYPDLELHLDSLEMLDPDPDSMNPGSTTLLSAVKKFSFLLPPLHKQRQKATCPILIAIPTSLLD
jgi:hypothetical protein